MADFDKEFFEGVKDGVTKGKIEYINIAGISPEVAELRHVKFRLPASKMHMNHVGMIYAGSYFVFVEATGASLIKCTYGSTYVPIIKNMSLDYKKPCTGDLVVDISMTEEEAEERIAYVKEHGKGQYPMEIPIADAEGNVCAVANITYYLMKK